MTLLARREHCRSELRDKLEARGFGAHDIDEVVLALGRENLISDRRFAEQFVRSREGRGQGPLRIRAELLKRQIEPAIIAAADLDLRDRRWCGLAVQARRKRFGEALPTRCEETMRQARFLATRGFTSEHIGYALQTDDLALLGERFFDDG